MKRIVLPAAFVAALVLTALAAPLLDLPDPIRQDIANRLAGAMAGAPLGRDEFGRDVLARLIWGARASLGVAFASAALACLVGVALGLIGGWMRGLGEILTLRLVDIVLCFPPILLALLVVTLLGPGAGTLILVLAVLYAPGFARLTYGEVLSVRATDYVEAVRALGASTPRILTRTVLPNIAGPILVQFSLAVAAAVVVESGLSFLGLGVVPPTPSWGLMIRSGRTTMAQAPLLLLWPCLALTITILAMNLLCDALRDAVDPRGRAGGARRRVVDRVLPGFFPSPPPATPGLAISHLSVEIDTPKGTIRPVDDVSLSVTSGETLAVVGESGSGKTLTALATMGLLDPAVRVVAGQVLFEGRDLLALHERDLRALRGKRLAMIFQDPMTALNPVMRVGDQIVEAIRAHSTAGARAASDRALELFRRVGIADPEKRLRVYPHEMSGGMRQRAMIAMALANDPVLLVADEPTTALDATVQAQILDLLAELRRDTGAALIFITHSLAVVAEIADRVVVMYAGQIVESGPVAAVFAAPRHPYTAALLAASPDSSDPSAGIPGTVPALHALPPGCRFAPRCPHATGICATPPVLEVLDDGRESRCARRREIFG
jgi:peptide/nickel transport system permease protein